MTNPNHTANLHKHAPATEAEIAPHSIEGEQAIIGSLLFNNEVFDYIGDIIKPADFFDPVHGRLFMAIAGRIERHALASPITISAVMAGDEGFAELGGSQYLTQLAASVSSVMAAKEYAEMIKEMAARRNLLMIANDIAESARNLAAGISPDSAIATAESRLYDISITGQKDRGFQGFVVSTTDAIKQMSAAYKRDGTLAGLSTGLMALDTILGGLQKSDLLILAGRPSMGKTALATNIAWSVARNSKNGDGSGGVVGFFSLEMSASQLAGRVLAEATEISSYKLRSGNISETEFRDVITAAKEFETAPLYIDDTASLPINQLAARARRLKRTHGLDLLVVDYLQLVMPSKDTGSRVNDVSQITQGLKAIAKELDIPVIALSQLSRKVEDREDKKPQLADLRDSGSIEQDADVVMFIYRAEYYTARAKPDESKIEKMVDWNAEMEKQLNKAEVLVSKQRSGPIGTVELHFNPEFTKFNNLVNNNYHASADTSGSGRSDDATDF